MGKELTLSQLKKLLADYDKSAKKMISAGEKLGEALIEILKPVIPDITYQLGDYEAGPNMLVLQSESNKLKTISNLSKEKNLEFILSDWL